MRSYFYFLFFSSAMIIMSDICRASDSFELDGVKYSCENKSPGFLHCKKGKEEFLVLSDNEYFLIFDKVDPPNPKYIQTVYKDGQLIYSNKSKVIIPKTQEAYKLWATSLVSFMEGIDDEYAKKIVKDTKSYLLKIPTVFDNVDIILNENEKFSCMRGATREKSNEERALEKRDNVTFACTYFSCKGKDPDEKVLFYMPQLGSTLLGPSIIAIKNGQARFYDTGFNVVDSKSDVITNATKSMYTYQNVNPVETDLPIDPDLLIPSKYNASQTSYEYLQQYAESEYADPLGIKKVCANGEVTKLFELEKKIASDMKDHLVYADIIAYVKSINGDVRSLYIDKEKAMRIGCYYQDKIIDTSAIPELKRMQDLSGVRSQKNYQDKYPSEKDIQTVFQKALKMTDIPFGYKYDGCYARAHLMARRFEKSGMKVKKAWIKGDLSVPGTDIRWGYHVAPLIEGKDSKGNIVQYVLDPSLTDKAVTLDEWVSTMNRSTKGPVMKTTYPIAENGLDFQRTVVAVSSSDAYGPVDMKIVTEEQKMDDAFSTLAEYSAVLESTKKKGTK
jgi:hypothetical protein